MRQEIGLSWRHIALAALAAIIGTTLALGLCVDQAQARTLEKPGKSIVIAVNKYKDSYGSDYESFILKAKSENDFDDPQNIKISNKKIVESWGYAEGTIIIEFKKPGTTKLSYKWKGKKHTVKITVKKYQNPLKSLKIGSKQFKSKFDKYATNIFWNDGSDGSAKPCPTGKIMVKPNKNWKIKSIKYLKLDYEGLVKVKNGGKLPKSEGIIITCYNKKTKVTQELYLH